jgi:AmmeMemoRadiSam system protein B
MTNFSRPTAVAGTFYPEDTHLLRQTITEFLQRTSPAEPSPKAIIVPHAGYIYSGPIAATAYAQIKPIAKKITRVVLLGPAHRVPFSGIAACDFENFITPLGMIPLEQDSIADLAQEGYVVLLNEAHRQEHSLEVQLPFLQSLIPSFHLLPFVVGDASAKQVACLLARLWGDEHTLIVISSDLSHYLNYASASRKDALTSDAIVHLRWQDIDYEDACGRNPVRGLLQLAHERHLSAKLLDLRNSGDTAGSKDRVVGYGAYAFYE